MSNPSFSDPVSDEILSAYVDGELSPSEVLAVERWLKSSPQARQKLADFRRISGLLQDLPHEELPEEFASEVLMQAERQMLLPAQRSVAVPSVIRRARFWAVSAGLPVTAACLLVAIQWNRPENAPEVAGALHKAAPASAREAIVSNDVSRLRSDEEQPMPVARAVVAGASDSEQSPQAKKRQEDSPPPVVATSDTTSNGLESGTGIRRPGETQAAGKESIAAVLNQIKELNDSGKIPVVRIFVVDRQDGLEVLQVMLEGQKIVRDESSTTGRHQEETASDKRALFVVASAKELTSALKALEEKSGAIGSWMLSEPVELARFDRGTQTRMSELMELVADARPEPPTGIVVGAAAAVAGPSGRDVASTETPARRPSSKTGSRKPVASRGNTSSERATSSDREGGGLADVPFSKPGRRTPAAPGRQVLVTMDDSIAPSQPGSTHPDANVTRASETGRGGPGSTAKGNETPETDVGIRSAAIDRQPPMRVLFIVERQPSPPAAAPPAKESPGGGAA